jgi:hypothetical protein
MKLATGKIEMLKLAAARFAVLPVLVFGSATALATNCIFPPSMEGEWQVACSVFKSDGKKLTFTRTASGDAYVHQGLERCLMSESFDQKIDFYVYSVASQRNCSAGASSDLLATYIFQDGETRLEVVRNAVTTALVDCKAYGRNYHSQYGEIAYAPR